MSVTPTEPTPTADAQPTTPASPEQPAAAATPEPPKPTPTEPSKANPWDDPKAAQAEIERLRRENASARTNAKAQAAEEARKELAEQFGKILNPEAPESDPAKLTESLTTSQAEAKQARVELAVFRNAATAGADPAALLDSTTFLKSVEGIDPSDATAITAAIAAAVEANPRLAAAPGTKAPAPNPAQGASAAGPAGAVAQMTREDVERLARDGKHAEIDKARQDGRLNDLLGIK